MPQFLKQKFLLSLTLCIVFFAIGVILLHFGMNDIDRTDPEGYGITEGSYSSCKPYSDDGSTYVLVYTYSVDGASYSVVTDYATAFLPKHGSIRQVYYDLDDPSSSFLAGPNAAFGLIAFGVLFCLVPTIIAFGWLLKLSFIKKGHSLLELGIGLTLVISGLVSVYYISGGNSLLSVFETAGILVLIPILLIVAGVFSIGRSLSARR